MQFDLSTGKVKEKKKK